MKTAISRFGKFLSSMVMPNIGVFIAWGFLTALFIETGWVPNAPLATIVGPMLSWLLPVVIAGQGGYLVAGDRGRVIGMIAVAGCIMGSEYTMLMGAMVMGPLAGFVIKKFDQFMETRMPAGFEMLINNFSVGLLGLALMIFGFFAVGPFMSAILVILTAGVDVLVNHGLLPLVAIFIEPAKVLFLNNAINHGIFSPIGVTQVEELGKSIMFMLEANPGPGVGVLLAYALFCKDKTTRQSAPGAIIIHFLGGIHEIYFPYILMNPIVIIAPIVGNICAITYFSMFGCGLTAPASPGSIIAFLSMAPKGSTLTVLLGVLIAAAVSFIIAAPLIKMSGAKGNLEEATAQMKDMKAQAKGEVKASAADMASAKKVVFSCDAGMGSSAMGATKFRNRIQKVNPGISVTNTSVDNIPADADIVVCQTILADRAKKSAPNAILVTIGNFLADPALDNLYNTLANAATGAAEAAAPAEEKKGIKAGMLEKANVKLGCASTDKESAIRAAGKLLADLGYADPSYAETMIEREKLITTYMGMGIAIPHGTTHDENVIKKSGVVVMQYPEGVDFDGEKAELIFGIAGKSNEHLDILANICNVLEDEDVLEAMKTTKDVNYVLEQLLK